MRDHERASEIGWKEESQERRTGNRDNSAQVLADNGIAYLSKNGGAHLVVAHEGEVVDFWPGTGKFTPRGGGRSGRGVFNLLKHLGVTPCSAKPSATV